MHQGCKCLQIDSGYIFFLFLNYLKQVFSDFSYLEECGMAVLLKQNWSPGNVVWTMKLHVPSAWSKEIVTNLSFFSELFF